MRMEFFSRFRSQFERFFRSLFLSFELEINLNFYEFEAWNQSIESIHTLMLKHNLCSHTVLIGFNVEKSHRKKNGKNSEKGSSE